MVYLPTYRWMLDHRAFELIAELRFMIFNRSSRPMSRYENAPGPDAQSDEIRLDREHFSRSSLRTTTSGYRLAG